MLQTDLIQDFHHHRNSTEPRVQFTLETECQFALLDVQVAQNPDRSIDTSVHRTSNTKKYLNSTSHHPLAHKIAVERTLHSRAHTLTSSAVSKVPRGTQYQSLSPEQLPYQVHTNHSQSTQDRSSQNQDPKWNTTTPPQYNMQGIPQGLFKESWPPLDIRTTLRLTNRLCQLLVHPKNQSQIW